MTEIINQVVSYRPSLQTMSVHEVATVPCRKGSYEGYKAAASDLKKEGKGIWSISCKRGADVVTIRREA